MNFTEFKTEFLLRAKSADACSDEYKRAYKSESFSELLKVITDNFSYCCKNKIIDADLLNSIPTDDLKAADIHVNTSASSGWIYAYDSATVMASGSATVMASDSATVMASDSATVEASGSATVRAYGSATVMAYGSATVMAYDSATVRAYGSATVEAYGSSYAFSYNKIEHKVSDRAICLYYYENKVVLGDGIQSVTQKQKS